MALIYAIPSHALTHKTTDKRGFPVDSGMVSYPLGPVGGKNGPLLIRHSADAFLHEAFTRETRRGRDALCPFASTAH